MDKKKTAWENFREKAKAPFANIKKKKAAGKPGKKPKPLTYRRSMSVPDLRFVLPEPSPSPISTASDAIFFGSSGQSETSSITSGYSPLFADRLTVVESGPPMRRKGSDSALLDWPECRMSAPQTLYEEEEGPEESADAPAPDRRASPAPQSGLAAAGAPVPAPRRTPPPAKRVDASPDVRRSPPTVTKSREGRPHPPNLLLQKAVSAERLKPPSRAGTPPAARAMADVPADRWSLPAERQRAAAESADVSSLESGCGTPLEDRPAGPWGGDGDDLDMREPFPLIRDIFAMEVQDDLDECPEQSEPDGQPLQDQAGDPGTSDQTWPPDLGTTGGLLPPIALQRYLLTIDLKEGRNLVIRDRNGTSDPYVKFKLEGKTFYKSKVVYKNLNPRWNESFSFPLRDREHGVDVRVYDKDLTSGDFMGGGTLVLKDFELDRIHEVDLALEDPNSKEDDMGIVRMEVRLTLRDATIKRNPRWLPKRMPKAGQQNQNQPAAAAAAARAQRSTEAQKRSQLWGGAFGISLLAGQDMPQGADGDVYACFRLGEQKYKSKNLCIQGNPQWKEHFEFNQLADVTEPLQVEVFAKRGRKCEECWGLCEIDLTRLSVDQKQLYTHMLDPGKGRLVLLVTLIPCWGVSVSPTHSSPLARPAERDGIMEKLSLKNTHRSMREVGFLQVKVFKATDVTSADLNGKSDPFCLLELGNSKLQSHTIYKTLNPEWNQAFTFPVKDINDVLELTVYDQNVDKAPNFLGRVAIPLLTVENGQQVTRLLKKENLGGPAKGSITLELDVIYNPIRAGIKSFKPKEIKFSEDNPKFSKKVLNQNIYRVRKLSTAVLYTLQYIQSCFQWESTRRSVIALLTFVLTVWNWEFFMLPLFLFLLITCNYLQIKTGRVSVSQDLVNVTVADDDEEDEKEPGKKGLMDKIHMVQEIVISVQNILGEIANIGERIKNTFNWSLPFLSCLACLVLFVVTALLYYIPLRYIVLVWGVNKFTKKLRNPYAIDNNEILDFLKRVPSDVQKVQYSELRAPGVQVPRRRR